MYIKVNFNLPKPTIDIEGHVKTELDKVELFYEEVENTGIGNGKN